jgi:hypothetical protein
MKQILIDINSLIRSRLTEEKRNSALTASNPPSQYDDAFLE